MIDETIDKKLPLPYIPGMYPSEPLKQPITVYYGVYAYAVWSDSDYTITSTTSTTATNFGEDTKYHTIKNEKDEKVKK
jgi:hypothetical protein